MYKARIYFPNHLSTPEVQKLCAFFNEHIGSYTFMRENGDDNGRWEIEVFNETTPDLDTLTTRLHDMADIHAISDFNIEKNTWALEELSDDIDWLEHSHTLNPPLDIGTFFVYGSHYTGSPPQDKITLNIDAITAFGSGDHGTTKGCLLMMEYLKAQGVCPWNTLDMGTGSGILAIAAWKLWKAPIFAVDIDEECINVTRRHMKMNTVTEAPSTIACLTNPGFDGTPVQERGPYELVIANILAGPLVEMAADLARVVDDNGYVILSGIVNEKAGSVIAAYTAQNLTLKKHEVIGEWSTLLLHRG